MPAHISSPLSIKQIRKSLLNWYQKNKRALPWRETSDPYAIWLSEIMLQQTTVETVIPFYKKFLTLFPTLHDLTKAQEAKWLKAWQGLGYYNRIRNFHKACKIISKHRSGKIPTMKKELIQLPGLGNYTAGAVASIAFGEPVPVVDGNVMRVLARFYGYKKDIQSKEAQNFFWKMAGEWVDSKNPGDFNQALMELGAVICTPTGPACPQCPLKKGCQILARGNPETLPVRFKKMNSQMENSVCLLFYYRGKFLFRKRDQNEILSGMWEFPRVVGRDAVKTLLKKNSFPSVKNIYPLPQVNHTIMNRRMKIEPFFLPVSNLKKKTKSSLWLSLKQSQRYPLTTISRKIIKSKEFQTVINDMGYG